MRVNRRESGTLGIQAFFLTLVDPVPLPCVFLSSARDGDQPDCLLGTVRDPRFHTEQDLVARHHRSIQAALTTDCTWLPIDDRHNKRELLRVHDRRPELPDTLQGDAEYAPCLPG